ncbi:MAG: glycosyltransferase family 4 protein [Chloroflexi bacterium]|nr:glycosyltransferase family 4 protein [Chloroflexota bacterium]
MKWVMVNPHLGPVLGGIQKDMLCLAREFITQGDRVAFVTTYDEFPEGRVDLSRPLTYELPPGLEVVRLEGHFRSRLRGFHPANPPLWLPGLARAALQFKPDTVIFFNIGWPLTILPAIVALRRKTIVLYRTAYHAHDNSHPLDPLRRRLQLRVAGLSHRLLTYSCFEKTQIIQQGGVPPERIVPVYPGVDLVEPSGQQVAAFRSAHDLNGKVVTSHVARLSAFKGTDRLIRVLPEIRRRTGRDVVLLLVGRNVEEAYLVGLARELGCEAHVRFTGPLSERDLHLVYAASDIFALPSQYESFGFVFLEAMAHGVPAIGVRTGGVPEVIREGETGFILDSHEDIAALTDRLVCLVLDETLRSRLGAEAREWTRQQFNWSATANAVKQVVEELKR